MSLSAQTNNARSVRRLVHWWQDWIKRRSAVVQLGCCDRAEVKRMAHDIGVSSEELYALAGKWPDSTDLLFRRIDESKLDATEIKKSEPQVMRDLERVCTLCASKRKCSHDLAARPSDPAWQTYCPNATTLKSLVAERQISGKTQAA
jgi:uncharacterized protein YjiS (DUF1127 family)